MIPTHNKLPDERPGRTHEVIIGGIEVRIRTGEYDDGRLAEVFIEGGKDGDELRLLDIIAICISAGLQRGIPLTVYTSKLRYQRMGTAGDTNDLELPVAGSIVDYVARWLELTYLTPQERAVR